MANKKRFQIGTFQFEVWFPQKFLFPSHFLQFEIQKDFQNTLDSQNTTDSSYGYEIHVVKELPQIAAPADATRPDLRIYRDSCNPALESRLLMEKGTDLAYAYYQEINETQAEIFFVNDYLGELSIDTFFTSLFALERHMLARNSLILHCAYIKYQEKAILFSAPSGVGKSTQAELWEIYEGAETINGDRGLLHKTNDTWMVSGWPVCGSSNICEMDELPIQAIVMLGQSSKNSVTPMSLFSAVQSLYSQITVNSWDRQQVSQAFDLLEDLCESLPIYQQMCDISQKAVQCLKEQLKDL